MQKVDPRERDIARKLAHYLAEHPEEIEGAKKLLHQMVKGRTLTQRRRFLQLFLKTLRRELALREILVEHAGPITEAELDSIRRQFEQSEGRTLRVRSRENNDLIAGMRLSLGDNEYDASVAGSLQRLAANVH